MYIKDYIELLSYEIDELIQSEAKKLTPAGEQTLHILFENCNHAIKWMKEKHEYETDAAHMPATKNPY